MIMFALMTVGEMREMVGIDIHALKAVYRKEQMLIPDSKASRRLDTDWKQTDPSALYQPDGETICKTTIEK